jgi:predicted PurR-regulated permease PerM
MTIVLCVVPLLGAPIIYIPLGLTLIMQGHYAAGVIMLLFCFGVVSQIDNLLRPWLIGAQTSLHPMSIFFSLLGGVLLFGPIGIMAGPIILTLALAMVEVLREINNSSEMPTETVAL